MYVIRNIVRFKFGKLKELLALITEWQKTYPFPNAQGSRFYVGYVGTPISTVIWDLDFENLTMLEEGNKQWEAMGEEMAPFYARWMNLVEESAKNELWELL